MSLVETAKNEIRKQSGYSFDPEKLEKAIEEGLQTGDRINVGGGIIAEINIEKDEINAYKNGVLVGGQKLSPYTQEQKDRLLVLKGIQVSKKGTSTGRP